MTPWQAWAAPGPHSVTPAWSEATQLSLLWGDEATRLDGRWSSLFSGLSGLGPVTTMVENAACALAVTDSLDLGAPRAPTVRLQGADLRLTLWQDGLGFAFATGTPRRKGLASGFSVHAADGSRLVAMELDEARDLSGFHRLAATHRAREADVARVPGPVGRTVRRDGGASLGPSLVRAFRRVRTHGDLDRLLDLRGIDRVQAYRLLAGQGTTPLDAPSVLRAVSAEVEADGPLCLAVGREGVVLRARASPERLAVRGAQLVLQGRGHALAVDLRLVGQAWAVDLDGCRALDLLDEEGRLMMRLGPAALFDTETERAAWSRQDLR